jgi:predicted metal-dependent HD superfamily phosphohydrolase
MSPLKEVFQTLFPLEAQQDAGLLFMDILAAYRMPPRAYHTISHLEHFYEVIKPHLPAQETDRQVLLWAMFYHDYVYDVLLSAENETRSADKAQLVLQQFGKSGEMIGRVKELILATRHHQVRDQADALVPLFLDADLSILGEKPDKYQAYQEAISAEYSTVPTELFRTARRKILEQFLAEDHIYHTSAFRNQYEAQARINLKKEIEALH